MAESSPNDSPGEPNGIQPAQRGPEFFHQPDIEQHEVTAHATYRRTVIQATGFGEQTTNGFENIGALYVYGVTENFAAGLDLGYTTLTSDPIPRKVKGFVDPEIILRVRRDLGGFTLRYGSRISFGFRNARTEDDLSTPASGGWALIPYIGLDRELPQGFVGGALELGLPFGRTIETTTAGVAREETRSGARSITLTGFYEHKFTDFLLGGALNFIRIGEETVTDSTGESQTAAYGQFALEAYGRVPVQTNLVIIPKARILFASSDEVAGIAVDRFNSQALSVAARWTF